MGLRERKKAKTRKRISEIARGLFLERGYGAVTVAEIAEKAEVAVTTLFNYFPTKEAIIFDLEDEIERDLRAAVRDRTTGQSILEALQHYFLTSRLFNPPDQVDFSDFMTLVRSSLELTSYFRRMWDRYENTLAGEIGRASGVDQSEAECLSRLIFEGVRFACTSPTPKETLTLAFKVLKNGWAQ